MRTHHSKRVMLGTAALTLLFAGSAFTAANTMPEATHAGTGTVDITGANVTNIAYGTSPDRSTVESVTFELASALNATTQAEMALDGTTTECVVGAEAITCTPTAPVPMAAVSSLTLNVWDAETVTDPV